MTSPAEPTIAKVWPTFLTAGTTFKLDRVYRQFNNTDWALSLFLVGSVVGTFVGTPAITPDPDGNTFHIVLTPAQTATLNPSGGASLAYSYVERLTATDGEVFDVNTGRIMISPNVGTAQAGDFLSPEEKLLTQLQATLAARIAGGVVESYSIAGRSITKVSTKELRDMIGSYKWIVYRQRHPGRVGVPGTFRFPPDPGTAPFPFPLSALIDR
jgi:hypothetical protein